MISRNLIDLTGHKYHSLTVVKMVHRDDNYNIKWECLCDCGNTVVVYGDNLRRNHTKSCGCKKGMFISEKLVTHINCMGKPTPEYTAWSAMKDRCSNGTRVSNRKRYIDRGIKVCERWSVSFAAFLSDMGKRPSNKHSLDRIENDKGYYKENCRWATKPQQANNTNRNVWYEHNGIRLTCSNWAKVFDVNYHAISWHIKRGKSFSDVFNHFKARNKVNVELANKLKNEIN